MQITAQHHQRMGKKLQRFLDSLDAKQLDTLGELLELVASDAQSKGYQIGNPNWDED